MKTTTSVQVSAIFAPCLMLFVLIIAPSLKGDVFYRKGFNDPQWFYWSKCALSFYDSLESSYSGPGNDTFIVDSMYYDLLDSAGFNFTTTVIQNNSGWLNNDWYHGIKLFTFDSEIYEHARSQYRMYEIGNYVEAFFREAANEAVGTVVEDQYADDGYAFRCDSTLNDAGFLIDTTFWQYDQRYEREFHLELNIKIGYNFEPTDSVITITFGVDSTCENDSSENLSIIHEELWMQPDSLEDEIGTDDELLVTTLFPDSIGTPGSYHLVRLTQRFNGSGYETRIRVFWHRYGDIWLDWLRVFDDEYNEIAIDTNSAVLDDIRARADLYDDSDVEMMFFDEPWPVQYPAQKIIDDIVQDRINKRYFANLPCLHPPS